MSADRFPPGFVTEVRLRSGPGFIGLVGRHVKLTRTGRDLKGCCPFHGEKTPSFQVYQDHYHCFGCQAHGDAVEFLRRTEGLSFHDAVVRLATEVGMSIPTGTGPTETPGERRAREARVARQLAEADRERAERIAAAAAERAGLVRAAISGTEDWRGTPAWVNWHQVRGIPPAAADWSDVLRWEPGINDLGALLVIATDGLGEPVMVQRSPLHDDGANQKDSGKTRRSTVGPAGTGAVVRLAGDPAGPLLNGEGAENVGVVAAVGGFEGWAALSNALGNLGRVESPPGRDLLLISDGDDPAGAVALALEQRAAALRAMGHRVAIVRPKPADEWNGHKHDFVDLVKAGGAAAVRERIEVALAELADNCNATEAGFRNATLTTPGPVANCDVGQLRDVMTAEISAWTRGLGPAHLLNAAETSAGKGTIALAELAERAREKREARKRFIQDWRRDHPGESASAAADAADAAGMKRLRVAYVGGDHVLVAQHVDKARVLGFSAAHDAGLDRPYDPADASTPPRCSQPARVRDTRLAGEPVRTVACGIDLLGPHCVDRERCVSWQSIHECQHAEIVGTVAERATAPHMPRELLGFDFVLIDEPPDRVFVPDRDIMLDLLADHLLLAHPVRGDDDEPDEAATEEARAMSRRVRFVINNMRNGYWPTEAMAAEGCDAAFFARFVEVTDRRDRKTGMTAATPDDERGEIARGSFRNAVRRLCGFFRLAGAIQAGEEGAGRIEIAGDAPRVAILRPRAKLHPSLLSARVMVIGARLDLGTVRGWLPDVAPMAAAAMVPRTPHQTVVHIHRGGMGNRAWRGQDRIAWGLALVALEGDASRPDATGVEVHKAAEHLFKGLPGVIEGHHGGTAGRRDWEKVSTYINLGSRFLGPREAASVGAAKTGEPVPVKPPVMMTGRIMLRDGRSVEVNVPDYEHPAAAAALRSVRDFDVMQGPFGRPRGPNRTAADPVTIIDVGSHIPRAVDYLITSPAQYAPDRFVRMAAEGLLVPSSVGRRRLHPAIYPKEWTGQNDKRNEAGGFLATALRVISPEWRAGPREAWAIGHYWRTGHAHREAGEPFVCRHRDLAMHMAALRDREGADRVVVERVIRPAPTAGELAINGQERVNRGFIVTSHETPLGNGDDAPWIPSGLAEPARPPPDG